MNIPRNDMRQAMQQQPCAAFKAMGATPYACRNNPDECQCKKNGIIKQKDKPVVKYSELQSSIAIGQRVFVKPLNHPSEYVSNTRWALTTCVQSFVSNGKGIESFETENTRYVKA